MVLRAADAARCEMMYAGDGILQSARPRDILPPLDKHARHTDEQAMSCAAGICAADTASQLSARL